MFSEMGPWPGMVSLHVAHIQARTIWLPLGRQHFHIHNLERKVGTFIQISMKIVQNIPVDNTLELFQVMALWQKGDKPLSDPMLTQIYEAIWCH